MRSRKQRVSWHGTRPLDTFQPRPFFTSLSSPSLPPSLPPSPSLPLFRPPSLPLESLTNIPHFSDPSQKGRVEKQAKRRRMRSRKQRVSWHVTRPLDTFQPHPISLLTAVYIREHENGRFLRFTTGSSVLTTNRICYLQSSVWSSPQTHSTYLRLCS